MSDLKSMLNDAISAYKSGKLVEAEQICRHVIAAEPDVFIAHHILAAIQSSQGKKHEALASYDRALALQPDFAETLNNRGVILHGFERYDEAGELRPLDRGAAELCRGMAQPR